MIRYGLTILCLLSGLSGFTEEKNAPSFGLSHLQEWQNQSLLDLGYGNVYLLSNDPYQALEYFQKARLDLDISDRSSQPIDFLITFSQAITYDYLGLHDQCKQTLASLFLIINEYDEGEKVSFEEQERSRSSSIQEDSKMALEFLNHLVVLAPSTEVRNLLFSLVNEIEEELLPAFQFADASIVLENAWSFNDIQEEYVIHFCGSFWKRFRKWCSELADWIQDAVKIVKGARDLHEAYYQWKRTHQYHHMDYDEFKYYYKHRKR